MIRAYSYDVDFQRDIQPGDEFQVMYERYFTDEGAAARDGDILYAALTLGGKQMELYRYKTRDGMVDYFNRQGESIRKALLRTPIDGARVSSKFGMRRHPILGFSKMHAGMDFAAPTGTPIYAAGNGVIEEIGPERLRQICPRKAQPADRDGLCASQQVRRGHAPGRSGAAG